MAEHQSFLYLDQSSSHACSLPPVIKGFHGAGREAPPASNEGNDDVGLRMDEALANPENPDTPSCLPPGPAFWEGPSLHRATLKCSLSHLAGWSRCRKGRSTAFGASLLWAGLSAPAISTYLGHVALPLRTSRSLSSELCSRFKTMLVKTPAQCLAVLSALINVVFLIINPSARLEAEITWVGSWNQP